jgi:hypothetical protein
MGCNCPALGTLILIIKNLNRLEGDVSEWKSEEL